MGWLFDLFGVVLKWVSRSQDAEQKQVDASDALLEEELARAAAEAKAHRGPGGDA